MKKTLSIIAIAIVFLCVFYNPLSGVMGMSPLWLIGVLAAAAIGCVWIAPLFDGRRDAEWRYENRLIRRPGV